MAQNTVGPVHFNQFMDNGCWHTLIKMLDLTALLTKDRIEPLALPELFAGGLAPWRTLLPICPVIGNDTFLDDGRHRLRAVKEMDVLWQSTVNRLKTLGVVLESSLQHLGQNCQFGCPLSASL